MVKAKHCAALLSRNGAKQASQRLAAWQTGRCTMDDRARFPRRTPNRRSQTAWTSPATHQTRTRCSARLLGGKGGHFGRTRTNIGAAQKPLLNPPAVTTPLPKILTMRTELATRKRERDKIMLCIFRPVAAVFFWFALVPFLSPALAGDGTRDAATTMPPACVRSPLSFFSAGIFHFFFLPNHAHLLCRYAVGGTLARSRRHWPAAAIAQRAHSRRLR